MRIVEAKPQLICEGLPGCEGPVFDTHGRFYVVTPGENAPDDRVEGTFVEGCGGGLYRIDLLSGSKTLACRPHFDGYGGRPAGCQSDRDDMIWIADMRLGLLKYNPADGKCIQLSKLDTDGIPLNGANDLIFDKDGNLWFTAPGGPIAPAPPKQLTDMFQEPIGKLYFLKKGELIPMCVAKDFLFCNGIAVKDNLLLVAETAASRILAFDITGLGNLANRRVWAQVPKCDPVLSGPDGMDFDEIGQLLVANYGSSHIEVFPPKGGKEPIARIKFPVCKLSNLQFEPGSRVCYVTEHDKHGVWKFEWEHRGSALYCG